MKNILFIMICSFFTNLIYAQKPILTVNKGHTVGNINQLQYSPDGKALYATGGNWEKNVKCWDIASGKLLRSFEGSFDNPYFILTPAGKELVLFSASTMNKMFEMRVWDLQTNTLKYQPRQSDCEEGSELKETPFYASQDSIFNLYEAKFAQAKPYEVLKNSLDGQNLAGYNRTKDSESHQSIHLLDLRTLKPRLSIEVGKEDIVALTFSHDSKYLACLQKNMNFTVWEVATGKKVSSNLCNGLDKSLYGDEVFYFNATTKKAIVFGYDKKAVLIDLNKNNVWKIPQELIYYAPDLQKVATSEGESWTMWDTNTQNKLMQNTLPAQSCKVLTISKNNEIAIGTASGAVLLYNEQGKLLQQFGTFIPLIRHILPKDDTHFFVQTDDDILLWNKKEGRAEDVVYTRNKQLKNKIDVFLYDAIQQQLIVQERYDFEANTMQYTVVVWSLGERKRRWEKNSENHCLIGLGQDSKHFWFFEKNILTKISLQNFKNQQQLVLDAETHDASYFIEIKESADSRSLILSGNTVMTPLIKSIDINTGKELYSYGEIAGLVNSFDVSVSQNVLVAGGINNVVGVNPPPLFALELPSGKFLHSFTGYQEEIYKVIFHPTETALFVATSADNMVRVWHARQEKPMYELAGHTSRVTNALFIENGKILMTVADDGAIILWDWATKRSILTFFMADLKGNCVMISPEGRFDGTPESINQLAHFVVGEEVIGIEQLKDRYYEPHLWKKLLGYTSEHLRQIEGLDKIDLYPDIELGDYQPDKGVLEIRLTERGGGIGKVILTINGKEAFEDVSTAATKQTQKNLTVYTLPIKNHHLIQAGKENTIEIKAYNQGNWLISRSKKLSFKAPLQSRGAETGGTGKVKPEDYDEPAQFYALCIGVSNYKNPQINLKLSAKDAEDIANALEIGAKRLFEVETKGTTNIIRLTSQQTAANKQPTRKNILATFAEIAQKLRHQDVLVIYLAGHGVNYGGQDGDFYFLTADALSMKLDDPAIRAEGTISSKEITDFFKKVRAQKQVLIMDACHSGKAIDNLMAKRDIEGTTIRALDKMKDRTGLHIISGCTADAVSYEASQFEQGLLTYSLLSGMQGKSLKEGKLIDINALFQHAREEVPELAKGIGGIQEPKVFSPYGGETFYLGAMTDEDKQKIKLPMPKPTFVPCQFADTNAMIDVLGLGNLINEHLQEAHTRSNAPFLFVATAEMPQAYRIAGFYEVSGNVIQLKCVLHKNGKKDAVHRFALEGDKTDLEGLRDAILKEIKKKLNE